MISDTTERVRQMACKIPESYVVQQYGRFALRFLSLDDAYEQSLDRKEPNVYSRSKDQWAATIDGKAMSCETSAIDDWVNSGHPDSYIDAVKFSASPYYRVISFLLRTYVTTNTYPSDISIIPFDAYELPTVPRFSVIGGKPRKFESDGSTFCNFLVEFDSAISLLMSCV